MNTTSIAIAAAGAVSLVGYTVFILAPAWASYGRVWERFAAGFLTLFMLATLLGAGALIGVLIVYFYNEFA